MAKAKSKVDWDVDAATYVGDGTDGVYFQIQACPDGWYMTAVVDSDTGSFVDTVVSDDGPYATAEEATQAGRSFAENWCADNQVSTEDEDTENA